MSGREYNVLACGSGNIEFLSGDCSVYDLVYVGSSACNVGNCTCERNGYFVVALECIAVNCNVELLNASGSVGVCACCAGNCTIVGAEVIGNDQCASVALDHLCQGCLIQLDLQTLVVCKGQRLRILKKISLLKIDGDNKCLAIGGDRPVAFLVDGQRATCDESTNCGQCHVAANLVYGSSVLVNPEVEVISGMVVLRGIEAVGKEHYLVNGVVVIQEGNTGESSHGQREVQTEVYGRGGQEALNVGLELVTHVYILEEQVECSLGPNTEVDVHVVANLEFAVALVCICDGVIQQVIDSVGNKSLCHLAPIGGCNIIRIKSCESVILYALEDVLVRQCELGSLFYEAVVDLVCSIGLQELLEILSDQLCNEIGNCFYGINSLILVQNGIQLDFIAIHCNIAANVGNALKLADQIVIVNKCSTLVQILHDVDLYSCGNCVNNLLKGEARQTVCDLVEDVVQILNVLELVVQAENLLDLLQNQLYLSDVRDVGVEVLNINLFCQSDDLLEGEVLNCCYQVISGRVTQTEDLVLDGIALIGLQELCKSSGNDLRHGHVHIQNVSFIIYSDVLGELACQLAEVGQVALENDFDIDILGVGLSILTYIFSNEIEGEDLAILALCPFGQRRNQRSDCSNSVLEIEGKLAKLLVLNCNVIAVDCDSVHVVDEVECNNLNNSLELLLGYERSCVVCKDLDQIARANHLCQIKIMSRGKCIDVYDGGDVIDLAKYLVELDLVKVYSLKCCKDVCILSIAVCFVEIIKVFGAIVKKYICIVGDGQVGIYVRDGCQVINHYILVQGIARKIRSKVGQILLINNAKNLGHNLLERICIRGLHQCIENLFHGNKCQNVCFGQCVRLGAIDRILEQCYQRLEGLLSLQSGNQSIRIQIQCDGAICAGSKNHLLGGLGIFVAGRFCCKYCYGDNRQQHNQRQNHGKYFVECFHNKTSLCLEFCFP